MISIESTITNLSPLPQRLEISLMFHFQEPFSRATSRCRPILAERARLGFAFTVPGEFHYLKNEGVGQRHFIKVVEAPRCAAVPRAHIGLEQQ